MSFSMIGSVMSFLIIINEFYVACDISWLWSFAYNNVFPFAYNCIGAFFYYYGPGVTVTPFGGGFIIPLPSEYAEDEQSQ